MSADAKIWQDDDGSWHGIHDLDCQHPSGTHSGTEYDLRDILDGVESCENNSRRMRWEFRVYPDGKAGLRGFVC
jgi:hypothetical protein